MINDASLVMIPSGYKDGKLYSVKPTDGSGDFTFSRGSNLAATRVNSEGLIEKGRENRLLQSNQFDTTWANSSTTETSGQSGYDGSNDAWLLAKTAASGYLYQNISQSGILTFSIYAKAGTLSWIRFVLNGSLNAYQYFDLSNGVLGSGADGKISASITDVGNGWYRCSLAVDNGTIARVRIYPADDDNDTSGTSGNLYIQDAQLEAGLVATDYIETTTTTAQAGILEDMPRLNYGTCPSLLLEPQRTNLVTQSEYLDSWTKTSAGTGSNPVLDFGYQSPEGLNNAYKVTFDKGAGTTTSDLSVLFTSFTSITNTASFYVKADSATRLMVRNSTNWEIYDITTEWTRIEKTDTGSSIQIGLREGYGVSGVPNSSTVYIYGAMVEAGSYPTSYIPTYGASVTRGNDGFALSSLPSFSNNTEFSIYLELTRTAVDTGQIGQHYYFYSVSPTAFNFWLHVDAPTAQIRFRDALSSNATMSTIPFDANETKKIIVKSDGTNFKTFADGTLISTYAMPTAFQLEYFTYAVKTFNLNEFLAFPTDLSDDECIALTT